VAHLQCHIGTDSVSLARLGAEVVGIDFSDEAIKAARSLSERAKTPVRFEVGNVYDAAEVIGRTVDLVYTSVGVIYWLEDLDRWAAAVADLLEPGGRFYLRDCHPQMWRHEEIDGALVLTQPHFHPDGSHYRWDESFTYTDGDHSAIEHTVHHEWFHTLPEIVNALAAAGLRIEHIEELQGLDWEFSSTMVREGTQWFLPEPLRRHVPVSFVIRATR
jgi:SAM-dependent methyltransferase